MSKMNEDQKLKIPKFEKEKKVWAEQEKCKEKVNWNEFECTNGEKALVLYCRCATLSTNRSQFKANMFWAKEVSNYCKNCAFSSLMAILYAVSFELGEKNIFSKKM